MFIFKSKNKNEKIKNKNDKVKYRVKIYVRANGQTDSVFWGDSFDNIMDAFIFAERMYKVFVSLGVSNNLGCQVYCTESV